MRRSLPLVAGLGLLAGCSLGTTAGDRTALHREAIPSTAPTVSGPSLRGTVRTPDGHLVSGATVYAETVLSKAESFTRGFAAFASLGLSCLGDQGCTPPHGGDVTALDGTFALAAPKGGQTPKGVRLTVVAERGAGRVATSISLPASALSGLDVGRIPIAAIAPTTSVRGGRVHLNPPPVAGASLGAATVTLTRLKVTGDRQEVADGEKVDVGTGADVRLIEDGHVLLESTQTGRVGGRDARFSASLSFIGSLVPPSRNAACHLIGAKGQPLAQSPCQLTDGVLDSDWTPNDDPACSDGPCNGPQQKDHRDIYVSFAKPIAAHLLIIRGCSFTCHVSVTDATGTHSLPDPSSSGDIYSTSLSGQTVRGVHLVTATGGFVSRPREVSVWP